MCDVRRGVCVNASDSFLLLMRGTLRCAVQASALGVVYPSLLLIYLGQGAYLVAHPETYSSLFYSAQPTPVYWPMFVISILASIVASQSIVTGEPHVHASAPPRKPAT